MYEFDNPADPLEPDYSADDARQAERLLDPFDEIADLIERAEYFVENYTGVDPTDPSLEPHERKTAFVVANPAYRLLSENLRQLLPEAIDAVAALKNTVRRIELLEADSDASNELWQGIQHLEASRELHTDVFAEIFKRSGDNS